MADDIVTRLQARCCLLASQSPNDEGALLAIQAANEIARLRAENEKLRAALAPFVDAGHFKIVTKAGTTEEYNQVSISVREHHLRAAAALKETGDD